MPSRDQLQAALRTHLENVRENLGTGVSFMVPFVTIGGVLLALAYAWASVTGIGVQRMPVARGTVAWFFAQIGENGLTAMVPVLGAAVAYSIAGRPGIAPGFLLSQIIQEGQVVKVAAEAMGLQAAASGAGYLGALVVGLLAGHVASWFKSREMPRVLGTVKPFLIVPVGTTLVLLPFVLFVIGVPAAFARLELMDWLANIRGGKALIVGGILGGMMAFDMGGPVNKVAYVFAFDLTIFGTTEPMAAVMVAGMTPPIGMAISNYVAREKYPEDLFENAKSTVILGCSFITEGAIPYAAADPLRVIPSLMTGSVVAGAASMYLGLTMPAPHGGLFVVPLSNSPVVFLAVILLGSVVTAAAATGIKPDQVPDGEPEAPIQESAGD